MDVDFLTSAFDPLKWTPFFDPIQHVPANLLGDMLFHGVDQRDPRARGLYSVRSAAGSPLREDGVWTSVTRAGSLFAGLDQCPQALLHHLSHGGVQGVQHHLQLVDSGCDSLSLDSVMMGIDKNNPNPHLFKSHRPVTLTSPLTRRESRSVRDMLVPSLEISGHLTPDTFAYRADHRAAFLALAFRAAFTSSLDQHRTVTVTDWDSADAFLRQQREDCTPLHRLPWDFGPWALKYYGRLRIHPLTDDGFAPPYSTEEGWNQGDNPSRDTYQTGELAVGGCLPLSESLHVPPDATGVPINTLSYSDDRRLLHPDLSGLVELTRLCTRATVAKGGLVHMDKLQFFAFSVQSGTLRQRTQPVHYYNTVTASCAPAVGGIPLSHALPPTPDYASLAEEVRRQRLRISSTPTHVLLALRTLWTFVLSQFDFIASGVAIPPHHVRDLAVQARLYYRTVLGLPCWTSRALQSLPMVQGGPGCPDLTLRAAVRLLLTYTQASFSRNLLA